jgi:hypothetical protein
MRYSINILYGFLASLWSNRGALAVNLTLLMGIPAGSAAAGGLNDAVGWLLLVAPSKHVREPGSDNATSETVRKVQIFYTHPKFRKSKFYALMSPSEYALPLALTALGRSTFRVLERPGDASKQGVYLLRAEGMKRPALYLIAAEPSEFKNSDVLTKLDSARVEPPLLLLKRKGTPYTGELGPLATAIEPSHCNSPQAGLHVCAFEMD